MSGPLYRQIADDLRRKIESGELAHGGRLPTEDQFMDSTRYLETPSVALLGS